ncbi:MAG: hypothetical protein LPK19_09425, partial [Hymenobacteraceae bacterium]|nr:hypothetical protein [Hymenobacteraceae bacterium]MDX5396443.1 hypothetical protein [Hymenobacteraceae bacterium]MDX5512504.1 hypothetical protein [Hymenobacteraceae bacterium]
MKHCFLIFLLLLTLKTQGQQLVWEKEYTFMAGNSLISAIAIRPDSGFMALGTENDRLGMVMHLNKQGDTVWTKRFGQNFQTGNFYG